MSAKVAAYPVQGRNLTTFTTRTGHPKKPRKKNGRTAEKNTSNGTLAKNRAVPEGKGAFLLALSLFVNFP
jgi:hypothetical protein